MCRPILSDALITMTTTSAPEPDIFTRITAMWTAVHVCYTRGKRQKKTKQGKRVFNPRTPKHKKYILPTYSRENAYVLWWELVVWSSFIWVSYEKSSSSYCSMQYFWWGCRGNLKLIALGSERVNRLRYYVHHQLPPQILLTLQVSVLLTMGYHCSPGVLDRVHVHLPAQAPVPRYCVAR